MKTERCPSTNEMLVHALLMELAHDRGHEAASLRHDDLLSDLGFDSLLTIELIVRLEDALCLEVPDELLTAAAFKTVGSVVNLANNLR